MTTLTFDFESAQAMLGYPNLPGYRKRDTSKQAAEETDAHTLRVRVLARLHLCGPLTADECAAMLAESPLAIRPRFSELGRMNKVADSGLRRRNVSGKAAIVWRLV